MRPQATSRHNKMPIIEKEAQDALRAYASKKSPVGTLRVRGTEEWLKPQDLGADEPESEESDDDVPPIPQAMGWTKEDATSDFTKWHITGRRNMILL